LVAVKVLDSRGKALMSDISKGIEWVLQEHLRARRRNPHAHSVLNGSLGGEYSRALEAMVQNAVEAGIHVVVAAGNDRQNSCYYSPAASPYAITVSATTQEDTLASFSNYGSCVDLLAPGEGILSAWRGSRTATKTMSGTSMAAPFVSGLIAYFLSQYPGQVISPDQMRRYLEQLAVQNMIRGIPSSYDQAWPNEPTPNLLVNNGIGSGSQMLHQFEMLHVNHTGRRLRRARVLDVEENQYSSGSSELWIQLRDWVSEKLQRWI
jgi:cerevisin